MQSAGKTKSPPPHFIRQWSRGRRRTVGWSALAVSFIVVPLLIVAAGTAMGFNQCDYDPIPVGAWQCTHAGRLLGMVVMIGIGLPVARKWSRFLQNMIFYRDNEPVEAAGRGGGSDAPVAATAKPLSLGQTLLSGSVTSLGPGYHRLQIGTTELTFWSARPLRLGLLKEGDPVRIIYQQIPGMVGLKLALVFARHSESRVHAIGVWIHRSSVVFSVPIIAWLGWLAPTPQPFWAAVAAIALCQSIAYLVLMNRARRLLE